MYTVDCRAPLKSPHTKELLGNMPTSKTKQSYNNCRKSFRIFVLLEVLALPSDLDPEYVGLAAAPDLIRERKRGNREAGTKVHSSRPVSEFSFRFFCLNCPNF